MVEAQVGHLPYGPMVAAPGVKSRMRPRPRAFVEATGVDALGISIGKHSHSDAREGSH